jgi:23S rRNA-/tRNA-specific pseudouridylate synthase
MATMAAARSSYFELAAIFRTAISGPRAAMATREAGPCKAVPAARALLAALWFGASAAGMCLPASARPPGVDTGASLPSATWRVVHCDDSLLVVDKGAGLLTVPGVGPAKADCLLSRLEAAGYSTAGHAPHRLDRDTSGLIAIGRTEHAHRALCRHFQAHEPRKVYTALVWGWPAEATGTVAVPIGKVIRRRTRPVMHQTAIPL